MSDRLTDRTARIAQQLENISSALRAYRSLGDRESVRRMERIYRAVRAAQ